MKINERLQIIRDDLSHRLGSRMYKLEERLKQHDPVLREIQLQREQLVSMTSGVLAELDAVIRETSPEECGPSSLQLGREVIQEARDEMRSDESAVSLRRRDADEAIQRLVNLLGAIAPGGRLNVAPIPETITAIRYEVAAARAKFPDRAKLLAALTEEVGELAQALLQRKPTGSVIKEAVQVAAVAIRLIEEGDSDFDQGEWGDAR